MKKILSIMAALVLLCALALPALAAEVPDLNRKGSITFNLEWEGQPLNSGSLTLWQVGRVAVDNADYSYVPVDALKNANVSLEELESPELARALAGLVKDKGLMGLKAPVQNGKAVFRELEPGLYLVTQEQAEACEGLATISAFLITLPQKEEGRYVYDITANPKAELEQAPTEPPTETTVPPTTTPPTEPGLPQTGQLNWPVPLLAIGGALLMAVGLLLKKGRKYEK